MQHTLPESNQTERLNSMFKVSSILTETAVQSL